MKTSTSISSVIAVLFSIFQLVPAPPAVAVGAAASISAADAAAAVVAAHGAGVAIAAAGAAGAAAVTKHKRNLAAETAALFVTRYPVAWKACQDQLTTTAVTMNLAGKDGARFDGVPPACMTLATVYLDETLDPDSAPIVLGTASLEYDNLTPEELSILKQALDAKAAIEAARVNTFEAWGQNRRYRMDKP